MAIQSRATSHRVILCLGLKTCESPLLCVPFTEQARDRFVFFL